MSRCTFLRALLVALATALAIVPGTALGAKPIIQFHEHFTFSFQSGICGIPVEETVVLNRNVLVYEENLGNDFRNTGSITHTYTNPVNGKSVIVSATGETSDGPPTIDDEAGTLTFLVNQRGLDQKIQTAQGPVLLRDAGFVQFAFIFDLATGEFISIEVVFVKGPHPDLDGDSTLFCEVITGALE